MTRVLAPRSQKGVLDSCATDVAKRYRGVASRLCVRVVQRCQQNLYSAVVFLEAADRSHDARPERGARCLQVRAQRRERRFPDPTNRALRRLGDVVVDEQAH